MPTFRIPDLSHYSSVSSFHAVADSGCPAAITKISQGTTGVDPTWAEYSARIRESGLILGGYHFLVPGNIEAQMEHFLATAQLQPGDLRPIIDAEQPGLGLQDTAAALDYLAAKGMRPILYCSISFWQDVLQSISDHALWIAAYRSAPPVLPAGTVLFAWQYTDHGTIPGIDHPCDVSLFTGDLDALKSFCL